LFSLLPRLTPTITTRITLVWFCSTQVGCHRCSYTTVTEHVTDAECGWRRVLKALDNRHHDLVAEAPEAMPVTDFVRIALTHSLQLCPACPRVHSNEDDWIRNTQEAEVILPALWWKGIVPDVVWVLHQHSTTRLEAVQPKGPPFYMPEGMAHKPKPTD
jgi:hypothetical protein